MCRALPLLLLFPPLLFFHSFGNAAAEEAAYLSHGPVTRVMTSDVLRTRPPASRHRPLNRYGAQFPAGFSRPPPAEIAPEPEPAETSSAEPLRVVIPNARIARQARPPRRRASPFGSYASLRRVRVLPPALARQGITQFPDTGEYASLSDPPLPPDAPQAPPVQRAAAAKEKDTPRQQASPAPRRHIPGNETARQIASAVIPPEKTLAPDEVASLLLAPFAALAGGIESVFETLSGESDSSPALAAETVTAAVPDIRPSTPHTEPAAQASVEISAPSQLLAALETAQEEKPAPPPPPQAIVSSEPGDLSAAASAAPSKIETPEVPVATLRSSLLDSNVTPEDLAQFGGGPVYAALAPAAGASETDSIPAVPSPSAASDPAALLDSPPLVSASTPTVPVPLEEAVSTPPSALSSEPPSMLSAESKRILSSIPSGLDRQNTPPPGGPVEIARAKDTSELFGKKEGVEPAVELAAHEAAGIRIELKTPALNADYELEKAYNALLSGLTTEAIEIYRRVLSNDPNNVTALFGLATTYHRAGQFDNARTLYGKALSRDPGNRSALNNFLALVAEEAPEEAIAQLEALEKRSPEFSPVPAQLAVVYQKIGNFDKASEKMLRAMKLSPENLTYRYNLAVMLDKQGKREEAAKLYRQLVEAGLKGESVPFDTQKVQERLTFLGSNR